LEVPVRYLSLMRSLLRVELPVQVDLPVLEDALALMFSLLRVEMPVQVDLPVPVRAEVRVWVELPVL
jgi:hypothetical protein